MRIVSKYMILHVLALERNESDARKGIVTLHALLFHVMDPMFEVL